MNYGGNMNASEYMAYAIVNKLLHKWEWVTSLLAVHVDGTKNDYIQILDGVGYVKVDNDYIKLDGHAPGKALLYTGYKIDLSKDVMECLLSDVSTTVGIAIVNYILLEVPFKGKITYMNDNPTLGSIMDKVKDTFEGLEDYGKFVISCTYLEEFSRIVTPSSTHKLVTPPPGLKKFKADTKAKYIKAYGVDWDKDPANIVAYDKELKAYYNEYISGDPSDGILASDKSKNNALAKKYLTFSSTNAFGQQVHIDESLLDGYPKDREKLAAIFNTTRSASISRGMETQNGGSVAKNVLRATSSMRITDGDCKTKEGKSVIITKQRKSSYIGRYLIDGNGKLIKLTNDNIEDYVDKPVTMRSVMYCKLDKPAVCSICIGDSAASKPDGISLIVTNNSAALTLTALKAMHNSQISTAEVVLDDVIS